ncbi:MAG: hypothetical protein MMC33_004385 [Icmadophila ericetorum]|nr:hypothetical protein [Icmadophila ericetorum]
MAFSEKFRSSKFRSSSSSSNNHGLTSILIFIYRFLQLVLALTVCGLYGVDLNNARKAHVYADSKWVYAEVVGGFAAFTCIVYMIMVALGGVGRVRWGFGWDLILFILWIALFGVFGKLYIKTNAEGDAGIQRMKNAVWVDLINALLWLFSAVGGAVAFFFFGERRSLHTGRAAV